MHENPVRHQTLQLLAMVKVWMMKTLKMMLAMALAVKKLKIEDLAVSPSSNSVQKGPGYSCELLFPTPRNLRCNQ